MERGVFPCVCARSCACVCRQPSVDSLLVHDRGAALTLQPRGQGWCPQPSGAAPVRKEALSILHVGRRMPRAGRRSGDGTGRDWRSHRVAVTGLVAAGGEMLWEMDCSGLQGLGDVWKMALEDFFPHLVDLRILILIYGLRFRGFRGAWSAALQRGSSAGEGPQGLFPPQDAPGIPRSPRAAACPGPALPCPVHNQ